MSQELVDKSQDREFRQGVLFDAGIYTTGAGIIAIVSATIGDLYPGTDRADLAGEFQDFCDNDSRLVNGSAMIARNNDREN